MRSMKARSNKICEMYSCHAILEHVGFIIFYIGELYEKAREKVKDDGYLFKKGYSRSSRSSVSSSSSEEKASDHMKNIMAEERENAIENNRKLLQSTDRPFEQTFWAGFVFAV